MAKKPLLFTAKIWLYPGETANWHFVTIPKTVGAQVAQHTKQPRRGFGAVAVTVTIGATTWQTSVFPDKVSGSYLLPIKAAVRRSEDLQAGETVSCKLVVR